MATLSAAPPAGELAGSSLLAPALGYDAHFLGPPVPEPQLTAAGRQVAVGAATGHEVVRHTHFSLVMHARRRMALWVAWNIDGTRLQRLNRNGLVFGPDPLVDLRYQTSELLYANNRLDRGHLARRADLCWGSDAEARQANHDSFYFTNITPQLENFNQSQQGGIWGRLEDALFEQVQVQALRVSVFGGPYFTRKTASTAACSCRARFSRCWPTWKPARCAPRPSCSPRISSSWKPLT